MKRFLTSTLALLAMTSVSFAGECAKSCSVKKSSSADIVDTAVGAKSFSTLVAAVKAADLVDTLKSKGPFTVFAPTDEAFAKLPKGTVETLLKPENKEQLQNILKYHVVAGSVMAKDVIKLDSAKTVLGKPVAINASSKGVMINAAKVVKADIHCSNGVIHVIDTVLLPPAAHEDITQIEGVGSLKTLLAAIKAAGLEKTLAENGPFTVFAPTDAAFEALPTGTVESLLKPENKEKLQAILKYHVVAGKVPAKKVVGLDSAKTVNGGEVSIEVKGKTVMVNDAKVLKTDVECGVGLLHVIDKVLLPKE